METKKKTQGDRRNIIRLGCAFGDVGQIYVIQPCRLPNGAYPECVRPVDKNGDMILSEDDKSQQSRGRVFIPEDKMIEVKPGQYFDLNNPYDKAIWECIENCPGIASSRAERDIDGNYVIDGNDKRYGIAELYVENEELETERNVGKEKNVFDAKSLVFNDPRGVSGRMMIAKIMGRNMDDRSDAEVTEFLLRIADRTPERIINTYTGSDLSLRFLFIEAREANVIRIKNKAYVYGDEGQFVLGMSDDAAIAWMKNPANQRVLNMIRQDVNPDLYKDLEEGLKEAEDAPSEELIDDMVEKKPSGKGRKA